MYTSNLWSPWRRAVEVSALGSTLSTLVHISTLSRSRISVFLHISMRILFTLMRCKRFSQFFFLFLLISLMDSVIVCLYLVLNVFHRKIFLVISLISSSLMQNIPYTDQEKIRLITIPIVMFCFFSKVLF